MPTVLVIPPEFAAIVEEQAVAAGYASALDYLYALVISDRRSHLETSLTTKKADGLRSVPDEQITAAGRGAASSSSQCNRDELKVTPRAGKADIIAALRRFEGLAPAGFKFDRDQANER